MPAQQYVQIAAELRRRIRAGEFAVGDELPSRSTLRAEYEVSQSVADKAMIVLWALGYTESLAGVAVYVRNASPGEDPAVAAYLDGLA